MLKVGITGGIGSGKTTVCRIFETLGIPVFYADEVAAKLMNEDEELILLLKKNFGNEIYEGKVLLSKVLAAKVFSDAEKLTLLESIIHPAVFRAFASWTNAQHAPYTLHEAALIYESHADKFLDKVISVTAPKALRFQRVMNRNNISWQETEARERRQLPQEQKDKSADFIIHNDEVHLLIPQVLEIHRKLIG